MKRKVVPGVIFALLSLAFLLQAANIQPVRAPETVNVTDHTMCKDVSPSGDPEERTNIFNINDPWADSWLNISGPITENHLLNSCWYDPDGRLFGSATNSTTWALGLSWLWWSVKLPIVGFGAYFAPFLGRYFRTEVLIDGISKFNESWELVGPAPPPPPPPRLVTPPPPPPVDVYRSYSAESAPMGVADYGIGSNGPYEYATNDSVGTVYITSLSTNKAGEFSTWMGFQLNVNLAFTTSYGQDVFWIQDVALIDTATHAIYFLDNVWNSSALSADMNASGISGNGTVAASEAGSFYVYVADASLPGNSIFLPYPAVIAFNVTSMVSSSGQPTVSFAYDDGYGLITYDTVTFNDTTSLASLTGFEVNGFDYKPDGGYYDSELILGGPGGGSSTTDIQSDVQLQLEYYNGHNYELIPNAYNFGGDTGEGISNVLSGAFYHPENGTLFADILPAAGQLGVLYNQSRIGIIDVTSPLASGTLYVANASNPKGAAWQIPFVNGEVNVTLYPGTYTLQLYNQRGQLFDEGNFTVNAGQTLSLQPPLHKPTIPGDINGDGRVGLDDLVLLAQAYSSRPGDVNWNPNADIDGNGVVGLSDLVALAQNYGKTA